MLQFSVVTLATDAAGKMSGCDEALPAAAVPSSVDLLHSTTSTNSSQLHYHHHHQQQQQQQHGRHLPHHICQLRRHCEPSSTFVSDVGDGHPQTGTDSEAEGCHRHYCCNDTATTKHTTGENNYLPR